MNYTIDKITSVPSLDFPRTILGSSPRQTLVEYTQGPDFYVGQAFDGTGKTVLFIDPKLGNIYTANDNTETFYAESPDGVELDYILNDSFTNNQWNKQSSVDIIWNDGTKDTDGYVFDANDLNDSCAVGTQHLKDIQQNAVTKNDLYQTGTTMDGDPIYELKNNNSLILKDLYSDIAWGDGGVEEQIPFQNFLSIHPLIFWTDPFNRTIRLLNTQIDQGCFDAY